MLTISSIPPERQIAEQIADDAWYRDRARTLATSDACRSSNDVSAGRTDSLDVSVTSMALQTVAFFVAILGTVAALLWVAG